MSVTREAAQDFLLVAEKHAPDDHFQTAAQDSLPRLLKRAFLSTVRASLFPSVSVLRRIVLRFVMSSPLSSFVVLIRTFVSIARRRVVKRRTRVSYSTATAKAAGRKNWSVAV
jgi:hypothetical protein